MNNHPQAKLDWRDGRIPISRQFDDPYFSLDNGLAETQHVFLSGNNLPTRFQDGFSIGELGFGTGLNFLVTWDALLKSGAQGHVTFTTFEAFPMSIEDTATALAAWPQLNHLIPDFLAALATGGDTYQFDRITLNVVSGDVRATLPRSSQMADAWFLDGFSPAKNPEMWEPEVMRQVGLHTKNGGTAATYTAAGFVRRGLTDAGFEVTRIPGFGRKRHMTTAVKL